MSSCSDKEEYVDEAVETEAAYEEELDKEPLVICGRGAGDGTRKRLRSDAILRKTRTAIDRETPLMYRPLLEFALVLLVQRSSSKWKCSLYIKSGSASSADLAAADLVEHVAST